MSKLLVDTNILVYAKDSSSIYHAASVAILESDSDLCTTSKNLIEYYSVVTKGINPLLKPSEGLVDMVEFLSRFEILYPTEGSRQKLFELIRIIQPKGLVIHDLEIASIALSNNIKTLVTYNISDFKAIEGIEVVVPK